MKTLMKAWKPALVYFGVMTVLCGILYPAAVTGIAQWWFPSQANGSVVTVTLKDGTRADYGSALIAQQFTAPEYLIGRPMGVTNLSPVSEAQRRLVEERVAWWRAFDPDNPADIPMDLVTASASGVDPNISPEAAEFQVRRIAKARGLSEEAVRAAIGQFTTGRLLGFLGEPTVNVLKVNLAMDGLL